MGRAMAKRIVVVAVMSKVAADAVLEGKPDDLEARLAAEEADQHLEDVLGRVAHRFEF